MGMFVVAQASSFHHNHNHDALISAENAARSNTAATTLGVGVGVGVIPLLPATPCLNMAADQEADNSMVSGRSRGGGGIQLWQNQLGSSQHHNYYMRKPTIVDHGNSSPNLLHSSGGGLGIGAATTSNSTTTCQDCGNQAKKDCSFKRCRTCCKSRSFDCSTHVRSTWVPASRRRERHLMNASSTAAGAGSSTSTSGTKKPRLLTSQTTTTTNSPSSTSTTTPLRSFDTGSSRQDASFKESLPGQVRAPAVFKCVRVTSVDDGEDEYAYQGVVQIGGHVFKGFLYDQGVEGRSEEFPNISELHLGSGDHRTGASSASPIIDPADVYASSGAAFLGVSSYMN